MQNNHNTNPFSMMKKGLTFLKRSAIMLFLATFALATALTFTLTTTAHAQSTWTARTSPGGNAFRTVTYGAGLFVALKGNTTSSMTSPDGITWTTRSIPVGTAVSCVYGGGQFVAVNYTGTVGAMNSPDGINWTARTTPSNVWESVTYGNGLFVAVGPNVVMTSPNGITWTARTPAANNNWFGVTYGNGVFVAVSTNGANRVMTSVDGTNWVIRSAADNSINWLKVTFGNGLFVAVASTGTNRVMTSTDGITWTSRNASVNNNWRSITYGNCQFVALANSGTGNRVMSSTDGINWTTRTSTADIDWQGLGYGNGRFAATGYADAGIMTSDLNPAPEINIQGNTTTLPKGHTSISITENTSFGTIVAGTSLLRAYTIQNLGSAVLNISSIVASGASGAKFVIGTVPTSINAGAANSFLVTYNSTVAMTDNAIITVNNNDCDEASSDFAVQGVAVDCATVTITPTSVPNGSIGTTYSQTLTQTGLISTTPQWLVIAGALPGGLSLSGNFGNSTTIVGTPNVAGTFTFTIQATDFVCTKTQVYTIIIGCGVISSSNTQTNVSCFGGINGTASISNVTGGTAPYTYAWSNGAVGATVAGLAAGTYTCTITDANSCTQTPSVTITQPTALLALTSSGANNIVCFGAATGGASVNAATGGTPPYSYNWTPGNPTGDGTTAITGLTAGTYVCTVTDANTCSATQSFTLTNVATAPIVISPATLPNGTVGTPYTATITQTGGNGFSLFSVVAGNFPNGLFLNNSTGQISLSPTVAGTFNFTILFNDGNCTQTKAYTIIIGCPVVTVTPTSTPLSYTVGTPITDITLGASGISGSTYNYAVTSGALPAGVTLNAGVISGTPTTVSGAGSFTITATSNSLCIGTATYTFAVACPSIVFTNTTTSNTTIGTAYNLDASASNATVYSVLPALPAGLSLNTTTGAISGTPTIATTSATYTVTATLGTCTATQGYTFAVACPSIIFTNTTASSATVGTAYNLDASASNATSYSVLPALPTGLSFNTTTGAIFGTPTIATTSATYTVTATLGTCSAIQSYTFAVACLNIVFTNTTALSATVGTAYNLDASASNATSYSISSALPAGLMLNTTTGAIFGTPTTPVALTTYTVTATQGICSATQDYIFAVACVGITITPANLIGGTVGTSYSQTIMQTGLIGTPTWSIIGTLPNGLTIDSATGIISGTPTTTGIATFAVSLTDGACSQTKNYSIAVACPAITFTNTTASGAIVGIAYTLNAGVTGNTGTIVYSVLPSLPAGLSFDTATGIISGTASAITASATYVVTATQTVDCATTQSYTFGVIPACSPVVLSLTSIPNATVGTPYSQTFTATGGTTGATYTFSTTSPQLASVGLSLSSAGVLSGTPRNSTSITFRVTATTTPNNCSGFKDYTITINPNPATSVDNSLANSVKVSPNPSNNDFNVDFGTINMTKSSVCVYDMQGKTVYSSENNSNLVIISLNKFANGIYLLEVKTENGRITKRLFKTN